MAKLKLMFTAVRNVEDDMIIATMECDRTEEMQNKETFITHLKNAITKWVRYNQTGKEMYEHSNNEFNFGDLSLVTDEPSFKNTLVAHGIFNFQIRIANFKNSDFDYDSHLVLD